MDENGINIDNVTITSEDADAVLHPYYFSFLTYSFLTSDKPYNKSWQAAICFYNNIWQVPAPIRVLAATQSVTQIYILARRDRLINFSTYSVSLKHIEDIGYWDTDVIPEDYRLFFKSYFAKGGDFEVEPIFLPIYADAAQSTGFGAVCAINMNKLNAGLGESVMMPILSATTCSMIMPPSLTKPSGFYTSLKIIFMAS